MTDELTQDVRIYDPRERKDSKRNPWQVRWRVGGKETSKSFPSKTAAKTFYGRLDTAYRSGQLFRKSTMVPVTWTPETKKSTNEPKPPSIVDLAIQCVQERRKKNLSGNTHKRSATALAPVLIGLMPEKSNLDNKDASVVLRGRILSPNPTRGTDRIHTDLDAKIRKDAPAATILADKSALRLCLDRMVLKQNGKFASRATFARRREELARLIGLAIRDGWITENLLQNSSLGWEKPRLNSGGVADPNEAMSSRQATAVITVVQKRPIARKYAATFAFMYWCFLRPGEARALQHGDIRRLQNGRGRLRVARQVVTVGASWSDNGESDECKHLKAREDEEERFVPIPASAMKVYESHIINFGGNKGDFVIPLTDEGKLPDLASLNKVWKSARAEALETEIATNRVLGRRLYSNRISGISRLISKGVPIPTIAQWAGNSPPILNKHYAKFIHDDEQRWIDLADE